MNAISMTAPTALVDVPPVTARLAVEPFRVFFPLATLSGIAGVAMWPLFFGGWLEAYPGIAHARIMIHGFFLAFIVGFLGTALPRLMDAPKLSRPGLLAWVTVYSGMVGAYFTGRVAWGDALALGQMLLLIGFAAPRLIKGADLPPPGFVLVGTGLLCGLSGLVIALVAAQEELNPAWTVFQRLLSNQGLVLLPILGVGGFLLPRFFGMPSRQDFPESRRPSGKWIFEAGIAGVAGVSILVSFALEASGYFRAAYAIRFVAAGTYLLHQIPWFRQTRPDTTLSKTLKLGLVLVVLGFAAVAILPEFKVALLHVTFVGGFAVITFAVATRVIFGHSGASHLLLKRHWWLWIALALMLLGAMSRIVGDFIPRIMVTHYNYAAACWIAGTLIWAIRVLPRVRLFAAEE